MSDGDWTHNENTGPVNGPLLQSRDIYGDVTVGRNAPADESLAQELAGVVGVHSREEEEHWRIGDPVPLRVRWHEAEADLFDSWGNIHSDQERHGPVPLSGQFTAIRETFHATGSQRLVVLGRAGAGKTVLAHRLILDLLDARGRRDPVPVLFSLGDWNPTTTRLREWMIDRLVRDFPFLDKRDIDSTGKRGVEVLVDGNWILPVLDGFDELPDGRQDVAIRQISQVQLPMLLTSRPKEYAQAARATQVVGRAAAIEIDDLTLAEAENYLRRSATPNRAADWTTVFEHLRTLSQQTASQNLIPVLTTPLMIMLARTHYEQPDAPAPSELLDTARFPAGTDLKKHLLSSYVDTIYDPHRPSQPSPIPRPAYTPDEARHWLGCLATRLQARDTHDFTWWQLPALITRPTRILVTTVMFVLAGGLALGLAGVLGGLPAMLPAVLAGMLPSWLALWLTAQLVGLFTGVFAGGLALGLAVGLVNEAGFARGRIGREPERLRPYRRRRGSQRRRSKRVSLSRTSSEFTSGLASGLAVGPPFWLAVGLAAWLGLGLRVGLGYVLAKGLLGGLVIGLVAGVVIGLVNVVLAVLGEEYDPGDSDQWQLLTADRTVTLIRAVPAGLLILTFVTNLMEASDFSFEMGLWFGALVILLILARSAWGNWLLFARLWLPLTGRLPCRPKRFLEDAHDRGMLRRAGAAYQFRHALLRDHLAEHHPAKHDKR